MSYRSKKLEMIIQESAGMLKNLSKPEFEGELN
jgi:hypothetical protein